MVQVACPGCLTAKRVSGALDAASLIQWAS
jgi:hypothetical protein